MSSSTEWIKCFSEKRNLNYWYNTNTNQSSWNEPYFSKTYKKYYYCDPKTKKSVWLDSPKETSNKQDDSVIIQETVHKTQKKNNMSLLLLRAKKKRLESQKKNKTEEKKSSNVEEIVQNLENMTIKKEEKETSKKQSIIKTTTETPKKYPTHKSTTETYAVSNGLGHYHEYEASSNWDKYDHMEYLRDLRDSMNPYN